jgi:hypothetical protein
MGMFILASHLALSQSPVNAEIESTYRELVKHVQNSTRQWLNTTKESWVKNPEPGTLRSQITKEFSAYNNREKESMALIAVVELIKENEKEYNDLRLQQQSVINDETKLSVIKSRLNYESAGSAAYYQAAQAIISKYSAPPEKQTVNSHPGNRGKKSVADSVKTKTAPLSQDSIPSLTKSIETTLNELHTRRQAAEAAFQPVDQRMNRLSQDLTTIYKSVTDLKNVPLRTVL